MTPRVRKAVPESAPGTRRALVEAQILEAATQLFAERGFAGTSLQDIADATGLTRPALYHYVASKEDLLSRLVSATTEGPASDLARIRKDTTKSVPERLRAMAASVALLQASHPDRFRLLIRSEADIPEGLAKTYERGRRSVLREFSTLIDEGVEDGSLRPVDPRTAALGIIGLCNWVAWWHQPAGDVEDQRVAAVLADMAVASVVNGDHRGAEGGGLGRVVELLRQDVAALERWVDAPPS